MFGKSGKVIDPVCGMSVDPATAMSVLHDGEPYYFCSSHCAKTFEANPGEFLTK